jgi:hypothetical protein
MIQNLPWESHIPFTRLELLGYKVTRSRPFPPDERALFAAFLRRIYPTPNPLDTQAGYDTYNHTDLAGMSHSRNCGRKHAKSSSVSIAKITPPPGSLGALKLCNNKSPTSGALRHKTLQRQPVTDQRTQRFARYAPACGGYGDASHDRQTTMHHRR